MRSFATFARGTLPALCAALFSLVYPLAFADGCKPEASADPDASILPKHVGLLVTESTFESSEGFVESFDPTTHVRSQHFGTAFDDDPHLRRLTDPRTNQERIFIVGSANGQLTEVDRHGGVVSSFSTLDDGAPAGLTDPLDVAIASDGSLWITRYLLPTLLVLEPDGKRRARIDLSKLAPSNGPVSRAPGMSAIAIVEGNAWVALRRLDKNSKVSAEPSWLVSIDTSSYAISPPIVLPLADPFERFGRRQSSPTPKLWLACIGGPRDVPPTPGGLVEIDLAARSARVILAPKDAFVNGFDLQDETNGYAILGSLRSADNPTSLVHFDPSTGVVDATYYSTSLYDLYDVAIVDDLLLVPDRTKEAPGIEVFARSDGAHLGKIATHLPPVELLVLRDQ